MGGRDPWRRPLTEVAQRGRNTASNSFVMVLATRELTGDYVHFIKTSCWLVVKRSICMLILAQHSSWHTLDNLTESVSACQGVKKAHIDTLTRHV